MKCQYLGTWSGEGCNEDAIPGTRYCHVHRSQGPSNEISDKVWGIGCPVYLAVVIVGAIILTAVSMCGGFS